MWRHDDVHVFHTLHMMMKFAVEGFLSITPADPDLIICRDEPFSVWGQDGVKLRLAPREVLLKDCHSPAWCMNGSRSGCAAAAA